VAVEWQVDNMSVVQAARAVEGASQTDAGFQRLPDDANIVVFCVMADKATFCGNVRIQDTAVGRRQRLRITVSDDNRTAPPKPGGLAGLLSKKTAYAERPEVIERAISNLKAVLPPI